MPIPISFPISVLKSMAIEHAKVSFLSHIEHLPLHVGHQGVVRSTRIFAMLPNLPIFVKYDGSPAVVFGRDPENGRLVVGTKSVFNRTEPKRCYSPEDIGLWYDNENPTLANIMQRVWRAVNDRQFDALYQADVLWTPETQEIRQGMVCCKPNTLTYAVPEKSEYGQEWKLADLGMVVHTIYRGTTWDGLTPGPATGNARAALSKLAAWSVSEHELNMQNISACFPNETERAWLAAQQTTLEERTDDLLDGTFDVPQASLLRYEHWRVRQTPIPNRSIQSWREFVCYESDKKAETYTTPKGRAQEQHRRNTLLAYADRSASDFELWFAWVNCAELLKNKWLKLLNRGPHLPAYNDALKPVNPEGYVVWHAGLPIKLVQREEFTRMNFLRERT